MLYKSRMNHKVMIYFAKVQKNHHFIYDNKGFMIVMMIYF